MWSVPFDASGDLASLAMSAMSIMKGRGRGGGAPWVHVCHDVPPTVPGSVTGRVLISGAARRRHLQVARPRAPGQISLATRVSKSFMEPMQSCSARHHRGLGHLTP